MPGPAEQAFIEAVNAPSATGRGLAVPHRRDVERIWQAIEPFLPVDSALHDAVKRYVVAVTRFGAGHAFEDQVEAAYAAMVDALSAGPGSQSAGKE